MFTYIQKLYAMPVYANIHTHPAWVISEHTFSIVLDKCNIIRSIYIVIEYVSLIF